MDTHIRAEYESPHSSAQKVNVRNRANAKDLVESIVLCVWTERRKWQSEGGDETG